MILFEYDTPFDRNDWLNYEPGIWFWTITPINLTVADDHSVNGYYEWNNQINYRVKSFRNDATWFYEVSSLADLRATYAGQAFYYDSSTTNLYVRFADSNPPSGDSWFGVVTGYSKGASDPNIDNRYYEPRIDVVSKVNKNKASDFFGIQIYNDCTVDLINDDGALDAYDDTGIWGQPARVLYGPEGTSYLNLKQIFSGFLGDYTRSWERLQIKIDDPRKSMDGPLAKNVMTAALYPDLNENNVGKKKPVAYGKIFDAPSICLTQDLVSSPYTFLICDTEFNAVSSLDAVRVNGVTKTPANVNLTAGTYTLTTGDIGGNFDAVTIDFTMPTTNGVDIIKDILYRYEGKPYISSFWDQTETSTSQTLSRNTSFYAAEDEKIVEAIESVCFDCDLNFIVKGDGKFAIKIYDANRTESDTITVDEWVSDMQESDTGNEFLSSVVVKYKHKIADQSFLSATNKTYEAASFAKYKRYKDKTYESWLYTEAEALAKSNTILDNFAIVQDVVSRETTGVLDNLEIGDFIICDPFTRISAAPVYAVYEILGISFDVDKLTTALKLKYVRPYTYPTYLLWVDSDGTFFTDSNGDTIAFRG